MSVARLSLPAALLLISLVFGLSDAFSTSQHLTKQIFSRMNEAEEEASDRPTKDLADSSIVYSKQKQQQQQTHQYDPNLINPLRHMLEYHLYYGGRGLGDDSSNGILDDVDDGSVKRQINIKRHDGPNRSSMSLSVINPLDVLRQRLALELTRRKQQLNQNRIEANAQLLNSIGKRSFSNDRL